MGRPVNTAWFGQYRQVMSALETELAKGASQEDVIRSHAQAADYSVNTFMRLMKAGRFLDAQCPGINVEHLQCGYALVEVLEKLYKVNPNEAQMRLQQVLDNTVSLAELTALYGQQTPQSKVSDSFENRSRARRRANEHERNSVAAIIQSGAAFFDAPGASVLRISRKVDYVAPHFMISDGQKMLAAIFIRTGTASKDSFRLAHELFTLALAQRSAGVGQVWFVIPSDSNVRFPLASLAKKLKISPADKDGWLNLAVIESKTKQLAKLGRGEYLSSGAADAFKLIHIDRTWTGKDVKTGKEFHLSYSEPNASEMPPQC